MSVDSHQTAGKLCVVVVVTSIILLPGAACSKAAPPVVPPAHVDSAKSADNDPADTDPVIDDGDSSSDDSDLQRPAESTVTASDGEPGQHLYARHCAACHGAEGDGQGIAATYVFPKPRDIQAGRFRLISTSNNVPSRDDLHAVLLRGMPGSSMPPWGHLAQAERDALVDEIMRLRSLGARSLYVKGLKEEEELTDEEIAAEDVQQEIQDTVDQFTTPGESTVVPEIAEPTEEGLVRAKVTYAQYGCLQCHGADGKGDGVQKMIDDEGYPTAPRDFTAGIFKGGSDPASLYRRIAYGMPGTPMPSSSQMTPEQMVELVHYIRSMSTEERRQAAVLVREKLVVQARARLPDSSDDSAWSDVSAVSLRMAPLWWRNDADPDLRVQATHDEKTIAIRLSWKDATPNWHAAQSEAFEDAVAVELYQGDEEPFVGMGDPRWPVDVWFWDADRQTAVDVEDQYPNVVVDIYPLSERQVTTSEFVREGTRLANQPAVSLPALAAGNQIMPGRAGSGGSQLTVGGPGSSTFRLPKSLLVSARGTWQDGRWTVVMTRAIGTQSAEDGISLEPGREASIAFAVWDGSAQDRDGKKLITIWQDLVLEQPPRGTSR